MKMTGIILFLLVVQQYLTRTHEADDDDADHDVQNGI